MTLLYLHVLPDNSDAHPMVLADQASLARTRFPGETAVHRSRVAPHGRPLINGLAISCNYSTRPGNISDIWKLGSKLSHRVGSRVVTVHSRPSGLRASELPNDTMIAIVYHLGLWFKQLRGDSTDATVALIMPNSHQALLTIFGEYLYRIELSSMTITNLHSSCYSV